VTIAVVDYGAGNLTSVAKAFAAVGAEPRVVRAAGGLASASAIVVPGVGHFGATMAIDAALRAGIREAVTRGVPLLGVCLGMQWLFEGSAEAPDVAGLGVFDGRCAPLDDRLKVPHAGWNTLSCVASSRLLAGIEANAWVYFTHSFAAPVGDDATAVTTYGGPFASCVERGSVFGAQWHPEKSGRVGRRVLENFVAIAAGAA
jgi:glutamine amidotransferase